MSALPVALLGCSAGGLQAIQTIFRALPAQLDYPIVVVQHVPPTLEVDITTIFGPTFKGTVQEAGDKTPLEPGHAYFAPPGYHLLIERDRTCSLSQDNLVHYFRPSIDVLFVSAANALGRAAVGVLLTGANQDGAEGLLAIQRKGGITIVQDPLEAQVSTMPQSALNLMQPNQVLNLKGIAGYLSLLSANSRSADAR